MVGELRQMLLEDAHGVTLRREDSIECRFTGARDDADALRVSLLTSQVAYTWHLDGRPLAFAGLRIERAGVGTPWLLTTDEAKRHAVSLHKMALRFLYFQPCDVLLQHADSTYSSALRWLARLGFVVQEARPWGPFGHLFCPVEWRREWTLSP